MSELVRDVGIPLKFTPWRTTSRYVHWFTRTHGRLVTLIRGALRPKSFFLGQCDIFATSDLVFYRRAGDAVHLARECRLVRPRPALREHWRAAIAASSAAELLMQSLPPQAPQPRLFDLTSAWLDALGALPCAQTALLWFELQFLVLEGLAPKVDRCTNCGQAESAAETAVLIPAAGGFVCGPCRLRRYSRHDASPLPPSARLALHQWRANDRTPPSTPLSLQDLEALAGALGAFLRHHLHAPLPGRELALELLREHATGFAAGALSRTIALAGRVAKLADAQDLGSCGEIRGGSNPPSPTTTPSVPSFPTSATTDSTPETSR